MQVSSNSANMLLQTTSVYIAPRVSIIWHKQCILDVHDTPRDKAYLAADGVPFFSEVTTDIKWYVI